LPEIRFDILAGNFAVIATERAKRPSDFKAAQSPGHEVRERDPSCPFCPGNEKLTPPELFSLREGSGRDEPGWRVRVVPNKFPALVDPEDLPDDERRELPSLPEQVPEGLATAVYWTAPGVGTHEVVIESTAHDATMGTYQPRRLCEVLEVIRERVMHMYGKPHVKYVQVFKNQGQAAGASLSHPHFQIIGLPVLPGLMAVEGMRQKAYEADTGRCLVCDLVERELEKSVRVVVETKEVVALCPFASRYSYETLVVPRNHAPSLMGVGEEGLQALAEVLVDLFSRYEALFPNLPYNLVFHDMPPAAMAGRKWPYHTHLHIYPRLNREAGLELATGVFINPSPPETCAEQLRAAK